MPPTIVQTIKQGDTEPRLTTTLAINGVPPPDPAGGEPQVPEVFLRKAGESCFSPGGGNVVIVDSATWALRYNWVPSDTDTPGIMQVEWRFTQGTGARPSTGPSKGYDLVDVQARENC